MKCYVLLDYDKKITATPFNYNMIIYWYKNHSKIMTSLLFQRLSETCIYENVKNLQIFP